MSAFNRFIVCSWNRVWNIVEVLLMMLLRLFVIAILLHHSSILSLGLTVEVSTRILETSSSSTHRSIEFRVHAVVNEVSVDASSHIRTWAARTANFLLHSFSRSLVTVLVLNTFQGKSELLWGQWLSRFSQFFLTMSKMAFLSKNAIFVSLIMPASFSFVLLVDIVILFGSQLHLGIKLIHHWLLGHLNLRIGHHAHHLHLSMHVILLHILLWHLLHVHCLHWLHAGHSILGHLVCSVHFEYYLK